MKRTVALAVAGALLLVGCAVPSTSTTSGPTTPSVTAPNPTDAASVSDGQPDPPCLTGDVAFHRDGVVAAFGDEQGNATQISSIRAIEYPGCEQVVIDLLTAAGAPARSIGPVAVETSAGSGIIRIDLPRAVVASSVIDSRFDGELVRQAYVVRTIAGALAIDIHVAAGQQVAVRSYPLRGPSRIMLDLIHDAAGPVVTAAAVAPDVVVVAPRVGANQFPLRVSGYARTSNGNVVARIYADTSDLPIAEQSTTAADSLNAWGEFRLSFPSGPSGMLQLFVGEGSVGNGSPAGVTVPLEIEAGPDASPPDV